MFNIVHKNFRKCKEEFQKKKLLARAFLKVFLSNFIAINLWIGFNIMDTRDKWCSEYRCPI